MQRVMKNALQLLSSMTNCSKAYAIEPIARSQMDADAK
jgi:hypothetical protein